ncbi:penicillin-binding protein activator [Wenzhouxiangella marina]|uniref:Uncharacterized protein n=1 Tax=Wenzhouxiangella marina TaxID=1579979 RepID=A0A0K0XY86_9GAMM|nr:penicillin-binding protein activator [Wenzhouxiangella marina]AKS42592.1 hypothetical protein WM2015_2229 [Wenzhouxiangella marina]MBB6085626.1 hypothetical protein [Wenzhouxiangella marina]
MAAFRFQAALALLITLALTACAPSGPSTRDVPISDPAFDAALEIEASGRHEAAAEAWLALADERPMERDALQLRAAEAWLRANRPDQARELLAALNPTALGPEAVLRHRLALAELALLDGDLATAAWQLAQVSGELSEPLERRRSLLDDMIQRAQANPAREALTELESALYGGQFSPDLALALLLDHPLEQLEQLQQLHRHRPELAPWLDLVVTARRHLLDPAQLGPALMEWERLNPSTGYRAEEALAWLDAWRSTQAMPGRILVALPGRPAMQRASAALRNGMLSAWLDLPVARRPQLEFREVEDREGAILGLWFEARESSMDFMLGPLERDQVDSLVALPDAGLPMLLLNHPSDPRALEAMSGAIQAIGLMPEEEAELAAVQALVLGHQRALVLTQSSDWGQRVGDAFERMFELGGGRIMDRAEYSPVQPDHSALLEVFLNLDRSEARADALARLIGQPVESEAQPRTDIDIIFLAARADDARLIRPQLRFFGVGDLPVFGTSHLISGAPRASRDSDLDGVFIPLPPWFLDDTEFGRQRRIAENRFAGLDNPTLSLLHALGADAFELVRWVARMQRDPSLYLAGRTGRLRLPDGRLIERDLPLVEIIDGRAEPVR